MEKSIKDKVAVVTGGASGIGFNIVDNFIRRGAKFVIISDINEELGNKAVFDIKEKYGNDKAVFFKCDVTSDLEKFFENISTKYKKIDLLVNNAGVVDENFIRKTININVTSLMEWSMMFHDYMRKDKNGNGGTIINVASVYGLRIAPFLPTYHGSKFAVVGFTKSLGHEYNFKRCGVRVVAVCPGFTYTKMTEDIHLKDSDTVKDFYNDAKSNVWQDVDAVGKGVIEIFERAESGSVWIIEGSCPPILN